MYANVKGCCTTMCPVTEIAFRRQNGLVHKLEMDERDLAQSAADGKRMVKEYSRSAAGKALNVPELLRPFPVLVSTVAYLNDMFKKYRCTDEWIVAYEFIFDRFRAVRQDMIVQSIGPAESVVILEAMVPFYIETQLRCNRVKCLSYDWKLHRLQIEECFSRWKYCSEAGNKINETIMACYLLSNADEIWSLNELFRKRRVFSETFFHILRSVIFAFKMVNIVRFFRLLGNFKDLVVRQAAFQLVSRLRYRALIAYTSAFKCKGLSISLEYLQRLLWIDIRSLKMCLSEMEVEVTNAVCFFSTGNVNKDVDLKQMHWNSLSSQLSSKLLTN